MTGCGTPEDCFSPWLDLSQKMGLELEGALARLGCCLTLGSMGPCTPSPQLAGLPGTLTLIICERSPASASSSTMFSSLSSINESKYLMMLGWFSCCPKRERWGGRSSEGQFSPAPAPCWLPAGPC